jgi:hypothetical protein
VASTSWGVVDVSASRDPTQLEPDFVVVGGELLRFQEVADGASPSE